MNCNHSGARCVLRNCYEAFGDFQRAKEENDKLGNKKERGSVKWKSSDKKVATVNSSGVVTAKKVGKAELSTKVENTTYICKLTVKKSNFKPVPLKALADYSSLKKSTPHYNDPYGYFVLKTASCAGYKY